MKKKLVVCCFALILSIIFISSNRYTSQAKGDAVLEEIAKYKSWAKIHKEDDKIASGTFRVTDSSVAG